MLYQGTIVFTLLCLITICGPASAEYYQYRDENGNLHFTDDKSQIPQEALDRLESFDSVEPKDEKASYSRSGGSKKTYFSPPPSNSWAGRLQSTAEELDKEKERLHRTFRRLQKEKQELGEKDPSRMSPSEESAYKDRIHELKNRIAEYRKEREAFKEKVDTHNSRIREGPLRKASKRDDPT
jgi:predicted RNase H-like nuclease (RuvC/YqgF family)